MAESIHQIMARIAEATPESQIAVFRQDDGTFKSQFAAPLKTRRMIEMRPPSLVGVYDNTMNQHQVLADLGYVKPKGRNYPVSSWTRGIVSATQ